MTLNAKEIEAIRKRAEHLSNAVWFAPAISELVGEDVPKLLAEIERLIKIIETVRDNTFCDDTWDFTSRALLGEEMSSLSYRISIEEDGSNDEN